MKLICKKSKEKILQIIVDEFNKRHNAVEQDPSNKDLILQEEAIRELLKRIEIYEK